MTSERSTQQSTQSGTGVASSRGWLHRPQTAFPLTVTSMLATLGTKNDCIAIVAFISAAYWAWVFAESLLRAIADSSSQRPPP